jgi:hypothetical protein
MNAPGFIQSIEASDVGEWLRGNVLAVPWVNVAHVLCVALVFGSILVVDLRLLGVLDRQRSVVRISRETLWLTWAAFAGAVLTGLLYFSANATSYWFNIAFRFKMLAILLAGVNMLVFQRVTWRGVNAWEHQVPTPAAARVAGALSILLWTIVIFFGRWIGFTDGYDAVVPEDIDFDFSGF